MELNVFGSTFSLSAFPPYVRGPVPFLQGLTGSSSAAIVLASSPTAFDTVQSVNKLIAHGIDLQVDYLQPIGEDNTLSVNVLASFVNELITIDSAGPTEHAGRTALRRRRGQIRSVCRHRQPVQPGLAAFSGRELQRQ